MTYVANPTDSTRPLDSDDASGGAAELRALKAYLAGLITGGSSFLAYGLAGFRNKIVNGNFDRWQRGTSLAAATGIRFLADRWITSSTGSTVAPSQQAFTLGQTAVPNEPTFFHRAVVASVAGASNSAVQVHRVESVRTFAGQTAILSFYAKADAIKNIAIEFEQNFGTGGSPSATVSAIGVTTKTLSTTFALYTVIVALPSITGKTIGTGGDDFVSINFWFDAGSAINSRTNSLGQQSGTFDIAQVQFEAGGNATSFEILPPSIITETCQRYFERWGGLGRLNVGSGGFASTTAANCLSTSYMTEKRIFPSIVISNATLFRFLGQANGQACTISPNDIDKHRFAFSATLQSGSTGAGGGCMVQSQDGQFPTIDIVAEL